MTNSVPDKETEQTARIVHLTSKFETIDNILATRSLRLKYCEEIFRLGNVRISSAAHPMVSFSCLRLTQLKCHKSTYGGYGIAFSDDWRDRNQIHRVLYLEKNSQVARALAGLLQARRDPDQSSLSDRLRLQIITLKCFTKNVRGPLEIRWPKRKIIDDFDFSAEVEWRFVPTKRQIGGANVSLDRRAYERRRDFYNSKLEKYWLKFSFRDIERIYLQNDDERRAVAKTYPEIAKKLELAPWQVVQL